MPKPRSLLRNELFVRIGDDTMIWLDAQRGTDYRSTYVRKVLESAARRDLITKDEEQNGTAAD
jgi:hypothetical protein